MNDERPPPPSLTELPEAQEPPLTLGLVRLVAPRDSYARLLETCDEIGRWPYPSLRSPRSMPRPSPGAVVRAKALAMAVGALRPGGPTRVLVGPSMRGGLVTTFYDATRDVTVVHLNNRSTIIIYGHGQASTLHVVELPPEEALWRVREDLGWGIEPESHGTSSSASAPAA